MTRKAGSSAEEGGKAAKEGFVDDVRQVCVI